MEKERRGRERVEGGQRCTGGRPGEGDAAELVATEFILDLFKHLKT